MSGFDEYDHGPAGLNRMESFGLGPLPGMMTGGDSMLNVDSPVEPTTNYTDPTNEYQYMGQMTEEEILNMINSPEHHHPPGRTIDPTYADMGSSLLPTPPVVGAPTNLADSLPMDASQGHYNHMGVNDMGGFMGGNAVPGDFGTQGGAQGMVKAEGEEVDDGLEEGPRLLVTHQLIHWIGTPDNAPPGADGKEYWLQKGKVFNIKVQLFDGQGNPITDPSEDIELNASLVYDNELRDEVAQINAEVMQGERTVGKWGAPLPARLQNGTVQFKLKMQVNSSQRDEQKFRVCIKPTDTEVLKNRNMWAYSEPVRVIAKLTKAKASRAQNTIEEEPEPRAATVPTPSGSTASGSMGQPPQTNWAEQISSQLNYLKGNLQNTQSQVESLQSNLTKEQRMRQQLEEENRRLREAIKKKRRPDE